MHLWTSERDSSRIAPGETGAPISVRRIMREATRFDHQDVDHLFSTLDLRDPVSYRIFLTIHHTALSTLGARWRAEDRDDFSALLHCLVDDLQALGDLVTVPRAAQRQRAYSIRQWGVAYVIRGSRLGGAVLRQRVPSGYPASYLTYAPTLSWPEFLKRLEQETRATDRLAHTHMIRGAKQAFETFKHAAVGFGLGQ
jgi:heme oxygenase